MLRTVVLMGLALAGGQPALAADPCNLRVGWEPYAPYTFADATGAPTGIDIEVITALAHEVGCTIEFAELPWARILREVENGSLDVSTSTSLTEDRRAWAWFSEPYRHTEMAIYVRQGEVEQYQLEDLADIADQAFRLGVITDYYYGDAFEALAADERYQQWIDVATDYATNIRKLIGGRIDGYLAEDVGVMAAELARLDLADQVARYPLAVTGQPLRFMFSRTTVDAATVAAIDAAVARMGADGTLAAIAKKYLP